MWRSSLAGTMSQRACFASAIIGAAVGDSGALPQINVKAPATTFLPQDAVEETFGHLRACTNDNATGCASIESELLFIDAKDAQNHKEVISRRLSTRGRSLGVLFKGFSPTMAEVLPDNFPVRPLTDSQYLFIQPIFHPSRGDIGFGLFQLGAAGPAPLRVAHDELGNTYTVNSTAADSSDNGRQRFAVEVEKHRACDGDMRRCWSLYSADPEDGMIPSEPGACYSYQFLKTQLSATEADTDSVTNINWYTYAVANPSTKKLDSLHVYAVASGLHATNPSRPFGDNEGKAVGWYKASSQVKLQASPVHGKQSALSWVYSHPPTQNTAHQAGHTDSNTNSYEESFNLGFQGEDVTGGLSFSATQSHTSSYTVSTDITDWSVVEQSDGVKGFGQWRYDETWPVDNTKYTGSNFADNYAQWYSTTSNSLTIGSADNSGDGCQVKDPPALSVASQQTSSSIMWRADTSLIDGDGKMLINLDFSMSLTPYRLWCPVCCHSDPCNPCQATTQSGDICSTHHCLEHFDSQISYSHSWQMDAMALLNVNAKSLLTEATVV